MAICRGMTTGRASALLAELSETQTELFGNRSLDGVNGDPVCMR